MPALASAPIAMPAEQEGRDRGAAVARREAIEDDGGRPARRRIAATGSTSNGSGLRRQHAIADHDGERRGEARRRGEMPTSAGSASGLRNSPCITVPPAASSAPIMHGERDARQPHRPQHQLVARDQSRIAPHEAERGGQAVQRDAGRADRAAAAAAMTASAASSTPITSSGRAQRTARAAASRAPAWRRRHPWQPFGGAASRTAASRCASAG